MWHKQFSGSGFWSKVKLDAPFPATPPLTYNLMTGDKCHADIAYKIV